MILASVSTARAAGPESGLDARAWELVSPIEKNGGEVGPPGGEAAGVLQAAAGGDGLAFGSLASFGAAEGSLPVNQYLARRGATGWTTENVTPPALSGAYDGGAYGLFSEDLARATIDSDNLYLREGNAYTPLVTTANSPLLTGSPEDLELSSAGASPDLRHIVISTCAALIPGAVEVPAGEGCDPAAENLYAWEDGQLELVNLLPGEAVSAPGAALAAAKGAVSADGSRIYWTHGDNLYLRDGGETKLVAEGATFQTASRDGALAFFVKAGHLFRYTATGTAIKDLTPTGAVVALVGSSDDGAYLYYVTGAGLYRLHDGVAARLVPAGPALLPPATGRAQASADGSRFFFSSSTPLLLTDTNGASDVYEWEAQGVGSCQQGAGCFGLISSGRVGSATFVGASASGDDAFFATGASLLPSDPNSLDIYDARAGGGFQEVPIPTPCLGDDCQGPAPAPEYRPPPTASISGQANPPIRFAKRQKKNQKKKHHRRGRGKHQHRKGGRR